MKAMKYLVILGGLLANLAYLYIKQALEIKFVLTAVACYAVSAAIHFTLHECGHFLGGLTSGYRLVFLQIGPFLLFADAKGRLKFRMQMDYGGQCVMVPNRIPPFHFRRYNLGGVIANAAACLPMLLLLSAGNIYADIAVLEFIWVGLIKLAINGLPSRSKGAPNDACTVKLLTHSEQTGYDYGMYLTLYSMVFREQAIEPEQFRYERTSEGDSLFYQEIQAILSEYAPNKDESKPIA